MNELTVVEQNELIRLEFIIERGQRTSVEVGAALMEIRDSGLYKTYGTFQKYCKERWGYARQTAYQLIDSAKVIENVRNCTQTEILPTNEAQARPLTSLEPEQQQEATTLLDNGNNLRTVQALMGHSQIRTTEAYLHSNDDRKVEAIQSLQFGL
jgi:hypothetical protein